MFYFLSGTNQHSLPVCCLARQAIFQEDHPIPIINTSAQQQRLQPESKNVVYLNRENLGLWAS
jgi:hypothetical protein